MERGAPRKLGEGPSGPRADAGTGQRQLLVRGSGGATRPRGEARGFRRSRRWAGGTGGDGCGEAASIRPEQRVSRGASGSSRKPLGSVSLRERDWKKLRVYERKGKVVGSVPQLPRGAGSLDTGAELGAGTDPLLCRREGQQGTVGTFAFLVSGG